jgi:hypothetical protein
MGVNYELGQVCYPFPVIGGLCLRLFASLPPYKGPKKRNVELRYPISTLIYWGPTYLLPT